MSTRRVPPAEKDRHRGLVPSLLAPPPNGKLYRPSNGTEGEFFFERFCFHCERDREWREQEKNPCEILSRTMAYKPRDDEYPREWCYMDGVPVCTAYVPEGGQLPTDTDMEALGQLSVLLP